MITWSPTRGELDRRNRKMIGLPEIMPSTAGPDSLMDDSGEPTDRRDTRAEKAGVSRPFVVRLFATWPSAGFHWRLLTLTLDRFRSHQLTPLPMVRL
jgi:hypothetical protein